MAEVEKIQNYIRKSIDSSNQEFDDRTQESRIMQLVQIIGKLQGTLKVVDQELERVKSFKK